MMGGERSTGPGLGSISPEMSKSEGINGLTEGQARIESNGDVIWHRINKYETEVK